MEIYISINQPLKHYLSQYFIHILLHLPNHLVDCLYHLVIFTLNSHLPYLYEAGLVEVRGLQVGAAEPGLQECDVSGYVPQNKVEKEEGDGVQGEAEEEN